MGEAEEGKPGFWSSLTGKMLTAVTLVGGIIAIWQFWIQTPHHDISGTWILETVTQQSTLERYKNMTLRYRVFLQQNGTSFSGTGEKIGEKTQNEVTEVEYDGKKEVPIEISGTINGNKITAIFQESGANRKTDGEFHWKQNGKSWVGTFTSSAATSSGTSSLTRPPNGG